MKCITDAAEISKNYNLLFKEKTDFLPFIFSFSKNGKITNYDDLALFVFQILVFSKFGKKVYNCDEVDENTFLGLYLNNNFYEIDLKKLNFIKEKTTKEDLLKIFEIIKSFEKKLNKIFFNENYIKNLNDLNLKKIKNIFINYFKEKIKNDDFEKILNEIKKSEKNIEKINNFIFLSEFQKFKNEVNEKLYNIFSKNIKFPEATYIFSNKKITIFKKHNKDFRLTKIEKKYINNLSDFYNIINNKSTSFSMNAFDFENAIVYSLIINKEKNEKEFLEYIENKIIPFIKENKKIDEKEFNNYFISKNIQKQLEIFKENFKEKSDEYILSIFAIARKMKIKENNIKEILYVKQTGKDSGKSIQRNKTLKSDMIVITKNKNYGISIKKDSAQIVNIKVANFFKDIVYEYYKNKNKSFNLIDLFNDDNDNILNFVTSNINFKFPKKVRDISKELKTNYKNKNINIINFIFENLKKYNKLIFENENKEKEFIKELIKLKFADLNDILKIYKKITNEEKISKKFVKELSEYYGFIILFLYYYNNIINNIDTKKLFEKLFNTLKDENIKIYQLMLIDGITGIVKFGKSNLLKEIENPKDNVFFEIDKSFYNGDIYNNEENLAIPNTFAYFEEKSNELIIKTINKDILKEILKKYSENFEKSIIRIKSSSVGYFNFTVESSLMTDIFKKSINETLLNSIINELNLNYINENKFIDFVKNKKKEIENIIKKFYNYFVKNILFFVKTFLKKIKDVLIKKLVLILQKTQKEIFKIFKNEKIVLTINDL